MRGGVPSGLGGALRRLGARLALVAALLPAAAGCGGAGAGSDATELVLFVVLDTVRADHLPHCGYDRPTAPALERLHARAASTCFAYAPAPWTLPSHASYFTGRSVPEHGTHMSPEGERHLWGVELFPLSAELPTLAERMASKGFRTVAVSGNPVVSEEMGLTRGFDEVRVASHFGELYGPRLVGALRKALEAVEGRRVFVFLNVADAHHPWPDVPESVGWLPPREGMSYGIREDGSPWRRYMRGELSAEASRRLIDRYVDLYDFGIRRADATLEASLGLLRELGYLDGSYRMIVTSDHGEFLGQHGLTGHCCYPHEAVNRVPFLYLSDDAPLPRLERPFPALQAFSLALEGALPERPGPVTAVGYPSPNMVRYVGDRGHELSVAAWRGTEKLLWTEGRWRRYALDEDPAERSPVAAGDHPLRPFVEETVRAARRSQRRSVETDPQLVERLRELGYVE